jgi:hypothetical protein
VQAERLLGEERVDIGRAGSGISFMSDWSMPFQPAIDEPSNMKPSSMKSSSTTSAITVTCCSLPRGSVKRRST